MTHWAAAGLFADVLSQAFRSALPLAARLIWFGEAAPTLQASESPLQEHEHNTVFSQRDITLSSWARIMHFDTHPLTMRASRPVSRCDYLDFDTPITLHLLLENTQVSSF